LTFFLSLLHKYPSSESSAPHHLIATSHHLSVAVLYLCCISLASSRFETTSTSPSYNKLFIAPQSSSARATKKTGFALVAMLRGRQKDRKVTPPGPVYMTVSFHPEQSRYPANNCRMTNLVCLSLLRALFSTPRCVFMTHLLTYRSQLFSRLAQQSCRKTQWRQTSPSKQQT
jgi:hypothetical protein